MRGGVRPLPGLGAGVLGVALLAAWELYARSGAVDEFILPAPSAIAEAAYDDRALLWDNFWVTAVEVVAGIAVSVVAAVGLAVVLHFNRTARGAIFPLLVATQAVPIVIIAPLLVTWWGFGLGPKLAIVAIVCFFPIVVTTLAALARVDPDELKLMRTLDATRWQAFRYAEAPAALPGALAGAKIAVAIAVIGAVLAEYAGSSEGLGHLILQALPQLEIARAWAAVTVLALFAITLFFALHVAERRIAPWAHRTERGRLT